MDANQIINDFKDNLINIYGQTYIEVNDTNVLVMTQKHADQLQKLLENFPDYKVISIENSDNLGNLYIPNQVVQLLQHPPKEEQDRVKGGNLKIIKQNNHTITLNEISPEDLVRIYHNIVVVLHDFDNKVPKVIGWTNELEKFTPIITPPKIELLPFETICQKYLNTPYTRGGKSLNDIDCSGLSQVIYYYTRGIRLPRRALWQSQICQRIEEKNIQIGDLAFFSKDNLIYHVAIVYKIFNNSIELIESDEYIGHTTVTKDSKSIVQRLKENEKNENIKFEFYGRPLVST